MSPPDHYAAVNTSRFCLLNWHNMNTDRLCSNFECSFCNKSKSVWNTVHCQEKLAVLFTHCLPWSCTFCLGLPCWDTQSNPNIVLLSLSAHESLWTEIPMSHHPSYTAINYGEQTVVLHQDLCVVFRPLWTVIGTIFVVLTSHWGQAPSRLHVIIRDMVIG